MLKRNKWIKYFGSEKKLKIAHLQNWRMHNFDINRNNRLLIEMFQISKKPRCSRQDSMGSDCGGQAQIASQYDRPYDKAAYMPYRISNHYVFWFRQQRMWGLWRVAADQKQPRVSWGWGVAVNTWEELLIKFCRADISTWCDDVSMTSVGIGIPSPTLIPDFPRHRPYVLLSVFSVIPNYRTAAIHRSQSQSILNLVATWSLIPTRAYVFSTDQENRIQKVIFDRKIAAGLDFIIFQHDHVRGSMVQYSTQTVTKF